MKFISSTRLSALFALMLAGVLHASSTNLLPGITFYDGPEKLTGKLVFLLSKHQKLGKLEIPTNGLTAATIYEFDLEQRKLRKVTDAPFGSFSAAREGGLFCVSFWPGQFQPNTPPSYFAYSERLGLHRIFQLNYSPSGLKILFGHIFFETDVLTPQLVDYDMASGKLHQVELPSASKWDYSTYAKVFSRTGETNTVCFTYDKSETRLSDGTDYPAGVYAWNMNTGIYSLVATNRYGDRFWVLNKAEQEGQFMKYFSFNGEEIGFDSNEPSLIPEGFTLMASSANSEKVLHRFSWLNWFLHGGSGSGVAYILTQMSPDRHYALVAGMQEYYLVGVSTGKTRVLLKVNTEATAKSAAWNNDVRWVGAEQ